MELLSTDLIILILQYFSCSHAVICSVSRAFRAAYRSTKPRTWAYTSPYLVAPFSLFQFLYLEHDCAIDTETFARVARGPEYRTALRWLAAHDVGQSWSKDTIDAVIEQGDLPTIQWLRAEGCEWNEWSLRKAARDGHLHILQWAYSVNDPVARRAFRLPQMVMAAAAKGHFALVLWFYEIGTPFCENVSIFAAKYGHWDIVFWLVLNQFPYNPDYVLIYAAVQCQWRVIIWALSVFYTIPFDNKTIAAVSAGRGTVPFIRWLMREGFEYEEKDLLYQATLHGNFGVMTWLVDELKCAFDERIFEAAAAGGDLAILEWLRARECPFSARVCIAAAKKANYEVINWAREQLGCVLSSEVAATAAAEGHLGFLQWLLKEECPFNRKVKQLAIIRRQKAVIRWLNTLVNKPVVDTLR